MTTALPGEHAAQHLEELRKDVRDEIKRRMEQRDKYSIQMTISLGALVAFGFSPGGFQQALLAAPLVSIYFTVLILYSYRVHGILAAYLRDELEPQLAEYYGIPKRFEWENYYKHHANHVPGIRSNFFNYAMWVVNTLSILYLWTNTDTPSKVLWVASLLYGGATLWVTWTSRKR